MMNLSRLLLFSAWCVAIVAIGLISRTFGGESTHFFGIADDLEQTIRFKSAVEVVHYHFVAGQEVQAGDLILEVRQPDLEADLGVVREQIRALTFANREDRASMESEIIGLEGDLKARTTELDSEISELEAREDANQIYLQSEERARNAIRPMIRRQIEHIVVQKQALTTATEARVKDLRSRLDTTQKPFDAQIAELISRKLELDRQKTQLRVLAQFSGQIGSVLFKIGDVVPPYQPLLTLHGVGPTFVKGFIHESVFNDVRIRQPVWVRAAANQTSDRSYRGKVDSLGSRIVEYPDRLKINPMSQAWGREVIISLSPDHSLLLGEKVNIQLNPPMTLANSTAVFSDWLGGVLD